MNRRMPHLLAPLLAITAALLVGCDGSADSAHVTGDAAMPTVHVAAAASLAGVLDDLAPLARRREQVNMAVNASSSGTLAQQILHGAPADLFISANVRWMDVLEQEDRIDPATRINLLRNRLVLIAGPEVSDVPASLEQLPDTDGRIAIGEPTSVPAGRYAKQALRAAGVWDQVQHRLLPAVDVQAALTYVTSGAAPLGIVYATDAAGAASSCRVVLTIPADLHHPIVYPAAVLRDARDPEAAGRLLAFLQSPEATHIFHQAGFEPVTHSHEHTAKEP